MFTHETKIRVRYAETDQMGYVYYGNYAMYFEVARVESLRTSGFSYKQLEDAGVMMPVLKNTSEYLQPAKYDDLLTIKVRVNERPTARIKFNYEIFNEQNTLIHRGETVLAFAKTENGQPCRPPKMFMDFMNPYFE